MRTIGELEGQGCEAAGYRLSGDLVDHVCCRHLYGHDRMLVAWPAEDRAVVVLVAPHDGTVNDIYRQLLGALNVAVPEGREKPPCCDEADQPPADSDVALAITEAVERSAHPRRSAR